MENHQRGGPEVQVVLRSKRADWSTLPDEAPFDERNFVGRVGHDDRLEMRWRRIVRGWKSALGPKAKGQRMYSIWVNMEEHADAEFTLQRALQ
jgi:hypothetical protein